MIHYYGRKLLCSVIKEFCNDETEEKVFSAIFYEHVTEPRLPDYLEDRLHTLGAGKISVHGINYDRESKYCEYFIYFERFGIEHI